MHKLIEWYQTFDYKILIRIKFLMQMQPLIPQGWKNKEYIKAICFFLC